MIRRIRIWLAYRALTRAIEASKRNRADWARWGR